MTLINIGPSCLIDFSSSSKFSFDSDCAEIFINSPVSRGKIIGQFSFHTNKELSPWIKIKFPFVFHVKKIVISNRLEVAQERAKTMFIDASLYDDFRDGFNIFTNDDSVWNTKEIDFDNDIRAKFLKFSLKDVNYFHLKKIEIYVDLKVELNNYYMFDCSFIELLYNELKNKLGETYTSYLNKNMSLIIFDNNFKFTSDVRYCIDVKSCCKCSLVLRLLYNSNYNKFLVSFFSFVSCLNLHFSFTEKYLNIFVSENFNIDFLNNEFQNIHDLVYYGLTRFIYCVNNFEYTQSSSVLNKNVVINADLMAGFGFADRLRGVLSIINYCLDLKLDYHIIFNQPFPLSKYYLYKYDPAIDYDKKSIIFKGLRNCVGTFNLETLDDRGDNLIKKLISESFLSFDVVQLATNYGYKWSPNVFTDNFIRSDFLNDELLKLKKIIGFHYISISFRFLGKFGDFNEPGAVVLDSMQKSILLEKCRATLNAFISGKSNSNFLVLSDSSIFLNYIKDLPNVYVFPENIAHSSINAKSLLSLEEQQKNFDKTIIDFNLIMDADEIYLFKNEQTYKSHFPFTAAACAGKKCIIKYF